LSRCRAPQAGRRDRLLWWRHRPASGRGEAHRLPAATPSWRQGFAVPAGHGFYNHDRADYHRPSAMMGHSRAVAALRAAMGPTFDLEALWDNHLDMEFFTRDPAKTMTTMVPQPYVNHVP